METETDLRRHDLLIDGKRLPPGTGEYSIDINPATEEQIALVAQGSAADVDPVTHSAVVLAADRARAAAALIGPAAVDRLILSTAAKPGQRIAMVTLVFAGEPSRRHQ